jgi:trimeric autotransporter adhesin
MFKLIYLLSFLAVTSLLSCEKKVATPATTTPTNPNNQDTNSGKIFIVAGNGYFSGAGGGYSGDGGQATAAELHAPTGVTVNGSGNIYISDAENYRVRKVNTSGIISTFAGGNHAGYSGDGGSATAAELQNPFGLVFDGAGNLYIADNGNNRIRKVNAAGVITTFAGNGIYGYSGDGGPATLAELTLPEGLAIDGGGNLYIADYGGGHVRKVNTNGIISTIAGGGTSGLGDGGPATAAQLNGPDGVAVDGYGNVYIADYNNNRIRLVNTSGIISTFAGNGYGAPSGGYYYGDGGPATAAELNEPTDVKVDGSGILYIADASNTRVRIVNTVGIISTYIGDGRIGDPGNDIAATASMLTFPQGLALDGLDNLYIADLYSNDIAKVYK